MKHEPKVQFHRGASDDGPPQLRMREAITLAKDAVSDMTGLDPDSVVRCAKGQDGVWAVTIDVIESMARMGDNDLLASYEVHIAPDRDLQGFQRIRRYHREDQDG